MEATLTETKVTLTHQPNQQPIHQPSHLPMNNTALKSASLNHTLRQHIIHLLDENKRMNVSDIYAKLKLQQSVTSQHLALMRRAGLVNTTRDGRNIYYELNYKQLQEVSYFVEKVGIPLAD